MAEYASRYVVIITLIVNDMSQSILECINGYYEALLLLDNKGSQEMKDSISELNKKASEMKGVMFPIIKRYL